jgi:predicted O-methyltransferase YrrM
MAPLPVPPAGAGQEVPPAAVGLLATLLQPTDRGAEFGSGRSTLWFAARVAALTSVETNARWHETVTNQLKDRGVSNVAYILVPEDQPMENGDGDYARIALTFPDASLDFALVDGHYRGYSAKYIMPKIKPCGLLIIDNVNWHLPCQSKAPGPRPAELGPARHIGHGSPLLYSTLSSNVCWPAQ